MISWLKSLFKKRVEERHIYKCTYVYAAHLSEDSKIASFKLDDAVEIFVSASNIAEAQIELAKKITLSPHVYVHRIEKVLEVIP